MPTDPPRPAKPSSTKRGGVLARVLLAVVTAGIVALAWLAIAGRGDAGASPRTVSSSDVAPARVRTFDITTLASGELEARNQIELRSELESQSTIMEVVPEGEFVAEGDLLVRLNSDQIVADIAEEELRVEEARANMEAARTAYQIQQSENATRLRRARLDVELAQLALQQWRDGDDKKRRQELQLAIDKAVRDLDRLTDKLERSEELFQRNFLSQNELELDRIARIEAEATLVRTRLEYEIYTQYQYPKDEKQRLSDMEEAEAELDRVQKENEINLNSRAATLANRERQLRIREDRLANLQRQLELCDIHAPSAGLVVYGSTAQRDNWRSQQEGPIAVGRQVRTNDLLIVLPDTRQMLATVKVHESLAQRVRPGQPADVHVEAAGLTIPGRVQSVGVLAESGGWRDPNRREYTVRILLDPGDRAEDIKPSMRCDARIRLGRVEDALAVPVQAVFNEGQVRYVYARRAGGRYARVPVSVGRRSDVYAEITAGLEPDDIVLLREPSAGEVLSAAWTPEDLEAAGYALGEDGRPVPVDTASARAPADRPATPAPESKDPAAGES